MRTSNGPSEDKNIAMQAHADPPEPRAQYLHVTEVSDEAKESGESDEEEQLDSEHVSSNPFELLEGFPKAGRRRSSQEASARRAPKKGSSASRKGNLTEDSGFGSASGTDLPSEEGRFLLQLSAWLSS